MGFRETTMTSYVMVDRSDNKAVFLSDMQWSEIVHNIYGEKNPISITIEDVEDARFIADEMSDEELEKIHQEMTEKNDIKIISRIKAIQSLSDIHIREKMEELEDADEARKEKIMRAIEKERKRTREKLDILEKRRNLTYSSSLQGLCVLDVV